MRNTTVRIAVSALLCLAGGIAFRGAPTSKPSGDQPMQLGNFSVSLAVKDLAASQEFYEKLGFHRFPGIGVPGSFVIMQNGTSTIGLFKGMFDRNILTFNPGWDRDAKALGAFDDVRTIQARLQAAGIKLETEVEAGANGPAGIMLKDPDGNPILIDQHVAKPAK